LGSVRLIAALIPHDCADGFYGAFWRRPAAYLDPSIRAGISVFAALDPGDVGHAINDLVPISARVSGTTATATFVTAQSFTWATTWRSPSWANRRRRGASEAKAL
jgi:hypothetical protein